MIDPEDKALAERAAELRDVLLAQSRADGLKFNKPEQFLLEMIAALTVTVNELQDEVAAMMKEQA